MQDLKQYIVDEYSNDDKVKGYKVCKFKFTHSIKDTKRIVNISFKFVDSNLNVLLNKTIRFDDKAVSSKYKNKQELEEKFNKAYPEIISHIRNEYSKVLNEYNAKLQSLDDVENNDVTTKNKNARKTSIKQPKNKFDM